MRVPPLVSRMEVQQFCEARDALQRRLDQHGVRKVAIWGCAETGEAVVQLLRACDVEVVAAYDQIRRGDFCGHRIRDPRAEFDSAVPVIVASARPPHELRDISSFLQSRGAAFFFAGSDPGRPASLASFTGRHRGRRCFVVGNGPSLNQIDMTRLRGEITIGSNRVYHGFARWGFPFTYWSIEDTLVADDIRDEWNAMTGPVKFVPEDLLDRVDDLASVVAVPFDRTPFNGDGPAFSDDPARVYWGGTVTYLLLQIAAIMGCDPIYLVGVDCHYVRPDHVTDLSTAGEWQSHGDDPNHFFPGYFGAGRKWHDPVVDRMVVAYASAERFCRARGIRVFNATPGSRLQVFPRVEFSAVCPSESN